MTQPNQQGEALDSASNDAESLHLQRIHRHDLPQSVKRRLS
jgi:hypothetical protein